MWAFSLLVRASNTLVIALALLAACGPTRPTRSTSQAAPVELGLVTAQGDPLRLRDLRGEPVLLFIFTTFDDASQLGLTALEQFTLLHADLRVVGIAVQPKPEALLPLYQKSLDIPFVLAYEPENRVLGGETMLGRIETVPTFILLDAEGRIAARRTGAATVPQLEELLEEGS